jgi:hypothetical protein
MQFEQATRAFLAKLAERSPAAAGAATPDRRKSHVTLGVWYLRDAQGRLLARVFKGGEVRFDRPLSAAILVALALAWF